MVGFSLAKAAERTTPGLFLFMLTTIDNWDLMKAESASGLTDSQFLGVRMVANMLSPDRKNDRLLKAAFDEPTCRFYLDHGVIDWHHQSVFGDTPEIRARAILGRPAAVTWENDKPVVYGRLTKAHQIVREAVAPHLEADNRVLAASVGGQMLKVTFTPDPVTGEPIRNVQKMHWNHTAIAARPYVISNGSEVSLVKADSGPVMRVAFPDVSAYLTDGSVYETAERLMKALEAGDGSTTDTALLQDGAALQRQSLEGATTTLVQRLIAHINQGLIVPSMGGIVVFLKAEGYSPDEAQAFARAFFEGLPGIIKN